jgi:hypothetical protein
MEHLKNNSDYENLLLLRTHMSIILALNEKKEEKLAKIYDNIKKNNDAIQGCINHAPDYWDRPTDAAIAASNEIKEKYKELDDLYKKRNKYNSNNAFNKFYRTIGILKFLSVIVAIGFVVLLNKLFEINPEMFESLTSNKIVFKIFSVFSGILMFFVFLIYIKMYKKNKDPNKSYQKYQKLIDKKNREISDLQFKARETHRIYNKDKGKVNPKDEEKHKKLVNSNKKLDKKIEDINNDFKKVLNEFRKTNYVILEEDYQYADYLIFLFQSKRADNITVALQQLDMERRNVQLLNKLDSCFNSIKRSLLTINTTINNQTIILSNKFEQASLAIVNKLEETGKKISKLDDTVSSSTNKIVNATNDLNSSVVHASEMNEYRQKQIANLIYRGNQISAKGYDKIRDSIDGVRTTLIY